MFLTLMVGINIIAMLNLNPAITVGLTSLQPLTVILIAMENRPMLVMYCIDIESIPFHRPLALLFQANRNH